MSLLNIFIPLILMLMCVPANATSDLDKSIYITTEEQYKLYKAMEKIKSFKPSKQKRQTNPMVDQMAKIAENLRQAEFHAKQRNEHLAKAQSYKNAADFIKQHEVEINADFNQLLVQYVIKKEGRIRAEKLFAGNDNASIAKLEAYAKELSADHAIKKRYLDWSNRKHKASCYASGQNFGVQYREKTPASQ